MNNKKTEKYIEVLFHKGDEIKGMKFKDIKDLKSFLVMDYKPTINTNKK